ncbi:aminodeoxychorismate/anthranilate synthase component 2 [Spirochaetota bacterium]|nr:aminodeoxychorismate/anthranilate synthase component 2 [Spirochaetota bacterium]
MVLMIDNFDSFTYNLVHYLEELGKVVKVFRNNQITVADVKKLNPSCIVISPGPGRPENAGISQDLIAAYKDQLPILGVCLGMQCMGAVLGGEIVRSEHILHGKLSNIYHVGTGLFEGIKSPFLATRYHSLVLASNYSDRSGGHLQAKSSPGTDLNSKLDAKLAAKHLSGREPKRSEYFTPNETVAGFEVTAWTAEAEIMAIHHKVYPKLAGVQFHPESIASEYGYEILKNFLRLL